MPSPARDFQRPRLLRKCTGSAGSVFAVQRALSHGRIRPAHGGPWLGRAPAL